MARFAFLPLAAAALLTGCAAPDVSTLPPRDLAARHALVRGSIYQDRADEYLNELATRVPLTPEQVARVRAREVIVGDPEILLLAAWGKPTRINTTTTSAGRREQWVYDYGPNGAGFAYVENGAVTALQSLGGRR